MVTAGNVQERDGARTLLSILATKFRRLHVIWADGAYAGALPGWVRGLRKRGKVRLEIVRKAKGQQGFAVLPWRWIVERLVWSRSTAQVGLERLPETTEAIIHIAMNVTQAVTMTTLFKRARRGSRSARANISTISSSRITVG